MILDYHTRNVRLEAEKPEKPVSASTNPEDVMKVLDGDNTTYWQGNKGDYLTFAVEKACLKGRQAGVGSGLRI